MKREQKSLTNKGFSLVELIIVVAIMAVLVGVLAPQYLRYVEKTKLQKDNSAIAEVANILKISAAEEKVWEEVSTAGTGGLTYTFDASTRELTIPSAGDHDSLDNELKQTIDLKDVKLGSNTYATVMPTITIYVESGIVKVKAEKWASEPNQEEAKRIVQNF